jgi:adenosylcobinamide kinase/adenosylcobinamide-phosphate guanylyltransferase
LAACERIKSIESIKTTETGIYMNSNETYEIDKFGGLTLIIGGAYQGKLTYAVQRLGFNAAAVLDLAAAQCPEANVFDSVIGGNSSVYIHFEALTQKIAAEYADLDAAFKRLDDDFLAPLFTLSEKKRAALIAREIGCGVVPLSEKNRLWRELHGAALAKAAAKADSVIRLFCGLPERLK